MNGAEKRRLEEDARREKNWKRWGPYLAERQWGTIREDYSEDGEPWAYFPHDQARSRAYRWGEDGLLGLCDREGRLCFALALWNGKDPMLKERLFGLAGPEGNHGEDVKECYFYLDASPTHSYMRALYKYPQSEFPYATLLAVNRRRGPTEGEYELADTGVFDQQRYFDVYVEYAKASPDDVLIRIRVANRGSEAATLQLVPTLWFRNTWSWGRTGESYWPKPVIAKLDARTVEARHETLGAFVLAAGADPQGAAPRWLFTDNETNTERLFGSPNPSPRVKDAFHAVIVEGRAAAASAEGPGTKVGAWYALDVPPGGTREVQLRLTRVEEVAGDPFGSGFEATFARRAEETDEFYDAALSRALDPEERRVSRQACAGLLWTKQFYHYVVNDWIEGDPAQPAPPAARRQGRNREWVHLYNRDVISMPDAWEYPWYAAWDLAFHMIPFARLDPHFAKEQLLLFLREWYMHPNGQIPAYEWTFSDVNPPVHAWAAWRVYKLTGPRGRRDRRFLERVFQKLLINFTWWVNRKDLEGNHLFSGGFLGLDNIGVFDRSKPLPDGGHLEQADGTAWMAFYCLTMLAMALELAAEDAAYEDVASKFFEHFIAIADAMNRLGGHGLWNEEDGFYYDQLHVDGEQVSVRLRSMVGLIPLFACAVLEQSVIDRLPGFRKRLSWFLQNRGDLCDRIAYMQKGEAESLRLLAIPSRERLERVLKTLLDEAEFLSPHGVRSLSRIHGDRPYLFRLQGLEHRVSYAPAESDSGLFGGNSNWRGPVWFPVNYLLIEALERFHYFYGDSLQVECPTGSGVRMDLGQVAREISRRLGGLFLPDASGRRPCHGEDERFRSDPDWKDLVLFHEYFDGDRGRGLGASHQTGWTALAVRCIEKHAVTRAPRDRVAGSGDGRDVTREISETRA